MTKTPALARGQDTSVNVADRYGQPVTSSVQAESEKPIYQRSQSSFRWVVLFLSCFAMFGSCKFFKK